MSPKEEIKKAAKMLEEGEEKGVFVWASRLRHWLKEPDYIFWLGRCGEKTFLRKKSFTKRKKLDR